jgi:hypothetical protein
MIDEIRDGHCRITFAPDHVVNLNNSGADALVAFVFGESVTVDGIPIPEFFERIRLQSQGKECQDKQPQNS